MVTDQQVRRLRMLTNRVKTKPYAPIIGPKGIQIKTNQLTHREKSLDQ